MRSIKIKICLWLVLVGLPLLFYSTPRVQASNTENHCAACHSSCGQCHISRPESVEGGLIDGHLFQKRPPMEQVCTACHGSRIGKEYLGKNEGLKPDVHRQKYFVTVRHVPVDQDTFKFYVENGLKNFDQSSTWKMATPHNIQRQTPQNKTCNSCHGNQELFLLDKDVEKKYLNANKTVVVPMDRIPPKRLDQ